MFICDGYSHRNKSVDIFSRFMVLVKATDDPIKDTDPSKDVYTLDERDFLVSIAWKDGWVAAWHLKADATICVKSPPFGQPQDAAKDLEDRLFRIYWAIDKY